MFRTCDEDISRSRSCKVHPELTKIDSNLPRTIVTRTKSELRERIAKLESETVILRAEIRLLRKKLGPSAWRIDANKAEEFVHELVDGERTYGSSIYDLETSNGTKIEIKYSNLNKAMPNSAMRRWVWAHVLGRDNAKVFDRLILLAPHDPQFRNKMKDPDSRWVIFDVPYAEVASLMEKDGMIWTGTHPTKFTRRATHRRLMCDYQITRAELATRYK
jgi:hypothetical protein